MFSPWLPYRIRSAFDMTFSAVYEIGFRKPLFQKMIKNNYTMLLLILAKSIQQYKVILFYDSLKKKEVIMVPYHDIALYDDKKAGRRQSFKNSQTARTSAPSIYLLCSRNNDLGGKLAEHTVCHVQSFFVCRNERFAGRRLFPPCFPNGR